MKCDERAWLPSTPLGTPVEPEVKLTQAGSSGPVGTSGRVAGQAGEELQRRRAAAARQREVADSRNRASHSATSAGERARRLQAEEGPGRRGGEIRGQPGGGIGGIEDGEGRSRLEGAEEGQGEGSAAMGVDRHPVSRHHAASCAARRLRRLAAVSSSP